jgi:hypothetical protein
VKTASNLRYVGIGLAMGLSAVRLVNAHVPPPPPPPSIAQIKACVQQIDVDHGWQFTWRTVEVGAARHPRNPLEALAFGGAGVPNNYGYPVRVVFNLNGWADVDTTYWIIQNPGGHWEIAALCVLPLDTDVRVHDQLKQ